MNSPKDLKLMIEAFLISSEIPISIKDLESLFKDSLSEFNFKRGDLLNAIEGLKKDYENRSIEVIQVPSGGFRFQVKPAYASFLQKLLPEKQAHYSQATLETLALIAYRQPITRAEIEQIRGVSVNSQIVKTLLEREWIRVLGYKNVPGRPALYGTTFKFLNDFNLSSLSQLPKLTEMDQTETPMIEQGELNLSIGHSHE